MFIRRILGFRKRAMTLPTEGLLLHSPTFNGASGRFLDARAIPDVTRYVKPVLAKCATLTSGDEIAITGVTGATVTSKLGTGVVTVGTNKLTVHTAGTLYKLVLTLADTTTVVTFPFSEGVGTTVYGYDGDGVPYTGTIATSDIAAFWAGTQDTYFHNILYGYTEATNLIPNSKTKDAAVSGNVLPTGWLKGEANGLTATVVAVDTDSVDIKIAGTTTAAATVSIRFTGTNVIAAEDGDIFTLSAKVEEIAGNSSSYYRQFGAYSRNSSAGYVTYMHKEVVPAENELEYTFTVAGGATVSHIQPMFQVYHGNAGATVDYTLRFSRIQLVAGGSRQGYVETSGSPASGVIPGNPEVSGTDLMGNTIGIKPGYNASSSYQVVGPDIATALGGDGGSGLYYENLVKSNLLVGNGTTIFSNYADGWHTFTTDGASGRVINVVGTYNNNNNADAADYQMTVTLGLKAVPGKTNPVAVSIYNSGTSSSVASSVSVVSGPGSIEVLSNRGQITNLSESVETVVKIVRDAAATSSGNIYVYFYPAGAGTTSSGAGCVIRNFHCYQGPTERAYIEPTTSYQYAEDSGAESAADESVFFEDGGDSKTLTYAQMMDAGVGPQIFFDTGGRGLAVYDAEQTDTTLERIVRYMRTDRDPVVAPEPEVPVDPDPPPPGVPSTETYYITDHTAGTAETSIVNEQTKNNWALSATVSGYRWPDWVAPTKMVIIGHSFTTPTALYITPHFPNTTVVEKHFAGATIADINGYFNTHVVGLSPAPTHCMLMVGLNDVLWSESSLPLATMKSGYESILGKASAAGIKMCLSTISPGSSWTGGTWTAAIQSRLENFNTWIKQMGALYGHPVADLYEALRQPGQTYLQAAYAGADNLHLSTGSTGGYAKAGETFVSAVSGTTGSLAHTVTLTSTTSATRACTLRYRIPISRTGLVWLSDDLSSTTAVSGTTVYTNNVATWLQDTLGPKTPARPRQIWAGVQNSTKLYAIAADPATPSVFQLEYSSAEQALYIKFLLGFHTSQRVATVKFHTWDTAAGGARTVVNAIIDDLAPSLFADRFVLSGFTHGAWYVHFGGALLPTNQDAQDFGYRMFQVGAGATTPSSSFLTTNQICRVMYNYGYDIHLSGGAGSTYDQMVTNINNLAGGGNQQALSVVNAGVYGETNRYVYFTNAWAPNDVRIIPNSSPNVLPTPNHFDRTFVANQTTLNTGDFNGIMVDNNPYFYWQASKESVGRTMLNFRADHFQYSDTPLSFNTDFRVGLHYEMMAWEYMKGAATWCRAQTKMHPVVANAGHAHSFYTFPWQDHGGGEGSWQRTNNVWSPPNEASLLLIRQKLGKKSGTVVQNPWSWANWTNSMTVRMLARCACFGLFASMGKDADGASASTGVAYFATTTYANRDRATFRLYIPIIRALSQAGWHPLRNFTMSDSTIFGERFGDKADTAKAVYLTCFNPSTTSSKTFTMSSATYSNPAPATMTELISGQTRSWSSGNITVTLGPETVQVFKMVYA